MLKYTKQFLGMLVTCLALLILGACSADTTADNSSINTVTEKTYPVSLELESQENLLFSKYDVQVYLDEQPLGTIDHGTTSSFTAELTKGQHHLVLKKDDDPSVDGQVSFEVTGETDLRYRFESNRQQIILKEIEEELEMSSTSSSQESSSSSSEDSSSTQLSSNSSSSETTERSSSSQTEASEEPIPEVIGQDHPDLAAILTSNRPELGRQFAEKYKGKVIEFDGHVAYINPHGNYKTLYDILIDGGDWVSLEQTNYFGINMQFQNIAPAMSVLSELDDLYLGQNLHIKARVLEFTRGELLILEPIEVSAR